MPRDEVRSTSARIPEETYELAELIGSLERTSVNALIVEGLGMVIEHRRNDSDFQEKIQERRRVLDIQAGWIQSGSSDPLQQPETI